MSLLRRAGLPDERGSAFGLRGGRYEQRLFICSACNHTIERIVDANGDPAE